MNTSATSIWFKRFSSNTQTQLRLFCFPYAGGGSAIYRGWARGLPATIGVYAAELPGRGNRLSEAPFTQLPPLIQAMAPAIVPYLDKPFAFWGHSMGAIIAFELARKLQRERGLAPVHLFVSGRSAPQIPNTRPHTYNLPELQFLEELRRLNGTPPELLENPELMRLIAPMLRADFSVIQTYEYLPGDPLDSSITVFGGLQDSAVSHESLEAWREQISGSLLLQMFSGDHFFLHTAEPIILRIVSDTLCYILQTAA